jgi:hypothetical protein
MAYFVNDPISGRALSSLDKELRKARKDGEYLRFLLLSGKLTWEEEQRIRSRYKGVFLRRMEDAFLGLPEENAA